MRRTPWIIGLMAPVLIGVRAIAREGAPPPPEIIVLPKCTLEYSRVTMVGPNVSSQQTVIQELLVQRGDRVKAGQVLGRLYNKDLLAEREVRTVALELSETTVLQREADLKVEKAKLQRAEALFARKALSAQDFQIQQLAVRTADLDLQAARQNRRMAESQLHQTEAMLASRDFVSPHDGVVDDICIKASESAYFIPFRPRIIDSHDNQSQSLMYVVCKIVDIYNFKSVGYIDVGDAWRVRPGQAVRVVPELEGSDLPIAREDFKGKITFVGNEIDPKTRTCQVCAEVANRGGLLRSGLECRMEIDLCEAQGTKGHTGGAAPGRSVKAEDKGR